MSKDEAVLAALQREMTREKDRYGPGTEAEAHFRRNNARALAAIKRARSAQSRPLEGEVAK